MSTLRCGDYVWHQGIRMMLTKRNHNDVLFLESVDDTGEPDGQAFLDGTLSALMCEPTFVVESEAQATASDEEGAREPWQWDAVPKAAQRKAEAVEAHMLEAFYGWRDGIAPDDDGLPAPRPEYDPTTTTLEQRLGVKVEQLRAVGQKCSRSSIRRWHDAWKEHGKLGLVDRRSIRDGKVISDYDPRLVKLVQSLARDAKLDSTRTGQVFKRKFNARLRTMAWADDVAVPKGRAFDRMVDVVTAERAFRISGTARSRQQTHDNPDGGYSIEIFRAGERFEWDTAKLDVRCVIDTGVGKKSTWMICDNVDLTVLMDCKTKIITGWNLVAGNNATNMTDISQVLADTFWPRPFRPGWEDDLRCMYYSLGTAREFSLEERLQNASAMPVIIPRSIVGDWGNVFRANSVTASLERNGISMLDPAPYSGVSKPFVENMNDTFQSVLAAHIDSYTGGNPGDRGKDVDEKAKWEVWSLRDAIDEFITCIWPHRPHGGLTHPLRPNVNITPMQMYRICQQQSDDGAIDLPLEPREYIRLLPVTWRKVASNGVRIRNLQYMDRDNPRLLSPYRRSSGILEENGKWPIHYSQNDICRVYLWDVDANDFVTIPWQHAHRLTYPASDVMLRYTRKELFDEGVNPNNDSLIAERLVRYQDFLEAGPTPSKPEVIARSRNKDRGSQRTPTTPRRPPRPRPTRPAAAAGASGSANANAGSGTNNVVPMRGHDPRSKHANS